MDDKLITIENNKVKINKKRLKIGLLAIIIIIIITFSIGEIVIRIFQPQMLYDKYNPSYPTYPKEVEYDKNFGWSLVKNYQVNSYSKQGRYPKVTITHNSQGFRMDHEVNESKNILIMTGDSLTYGFWVDDKKIVSAKLNELLGDDWEVINLAVGGYGTDQSLLRFVKDGLRYKPKVVVHAHFNNDFSNVFERYQYNLFKPLFVINENRLELTNVPVPLSKDYELSYPKKREHLYKGFQKFMRSWSNLYIFYKNGISEIKSQIKNIFIPRKENYFTSTLREDGQFLSIERNYTGNMGYAYLLNSLILTSYNEIAKQNNITFILVLIGDRIAVDPKVQKATVERYYNIDEYFFDYEKPYGLLERYAESENIRLINLLPSFKKEFQENRDVYLYGDDHINDHGHEVFAKEVYEMLLKEGIV